MAINQTLKGPWLFEFLPPFDLGHIKYKKVLQRAKLIRQNSSIKQPENVVIVCQVPQRLRMIWN